MPRFNAQRFFLTYSQCGLLSRNDLADYLYEEHSPLWLELAREEHQDGGQHIHCVIVFESRFQKNMSCFDYEGFHPNVAVIKHGHADLYRCRHYIRKGEQEAHDPRHKGTVCSYTEEPVHRGEVPEYLEKAERYGWGDILESARDADEFKQLVRKHKPADYVLRNDAIEQFAAHHFSAPQTYTPTFEKDTFVVPAQVDQWLAEVFGEVSYFLFRHGHPYLPCVN